MALREELERSGTWLFRWRSYLPLVMFGLILLALREYEYPGRSVALDHVWEVACLLISGLGLGIRVFTIGHAPHGTSGRNTRTQVADTLNTSGLYSVARNPLYLGNFFMYLGVVVFAHLWWLTLIYILAFWLYYERIVLAEEAYLRQKFGETYLGWAHATPAFLPKVRLYRKPDLPFSLKNVMRREYNGSFAVVLTLFVLEILGDLVSQGKFEVDVLWIWILTISLTLWIVLRTIKHRTRWLFVEGR